jgi:hypothetical protein
MSWVQIPPPQPFQGLGTVLRGSVLAREIGGLKRKAATFVAGMDVAPKELQMAKMLIDSMAGAWTPETYPEALVTQKRRAKVG